MEKAIIKEYEKLIINYSKTFKEFLNSHPLKFELLEIVWN